MFALGFRAREKEKREREQKYLNTLAEELRKEEERVKISENIREYNKTHRRVSEGVVDVEGEVLNRLREQANGRPRTAIDDRSAEGVAEDPREEEAHVNQEEQPQEQPALEEPKPQEDKPEATASE